jgi:hypothetical protein
VVIFGIRILEGKCFEELEKWKLMGSLEVLMEAKEEKYTAIPFFEKNFWPFF